MSDSYSRGFFSVFTGNVYYLLIGLILSFAIPLVLDINNYATYRTFSLIASFAAIFHLGFPDGIYFHFGGQRLKKEDNYKLSSYISFFLILQTIISFIVFIIGLIFQEIIIILFSLYINFSNLQTYFQKLFIATSQFTKYKNLKFISSLGTLLSILIALIFSQSALIIISANIFSLIVISIFLLNKEQMKIRLLKINETENWNFIKIGIFIMLGNMGTTLFASMDRWFVKILLSDADFAYYSFAITIIAIFNLGTSSFGLSLYPKLVIQHNNQNIVQKLKTFFIIISSFSMLGYFIFNFIITNFISKYMESQIPLLILFISLPAIFIVSILYENIFKAQKNEKKYFLTVFKMLLVSFLLNLFVSLIYPSTLSFAICISVSYYIWLIYSNNDFPLIKFYLSDIIYLVTLILSFIILGIYFSVLTGMFLFFVTILFLILIFYKKEFFEMGILLKSLIKY